MAGRKGPALSYIRGKAVALYGCERENEGDDRRESARRREALLFLIAAGWEWRRFLCTATNGSGCFQCAAAGTISLGASKARGFVARFFDAAARRREALLFLIAAGWERGKPLSLYCDE